MNDYSKRLGAFYDELLQRHGDTPAGLDCGSTDSMKLRYREAEKMFACAGFWPNCHKVLDVGCGTGGFAYHCVNKENYTGIDLSARAVEIAKEKGLSDVQNCDVRDLNGGPWDLSLALGAMYRVVSVSSAEMQHQQIIRAMWQRTHKMMILSFLCDTAAIKNVDEIYYDASYMFDWASSHLSKRVVLNRSYADHEFLLGVIRCR
jgi:SAM-dependent methyltransferase